MGLWLDIHWPNSRNRVFETRLWLQSTGQKIWAGHSCNAEYLQHAPEELLQDRRAPSRQSRPLTEVIYVDIDVLDLLNHNV